jgi:hypothetical protein
MQKTCSLTSITIILILWLVSPTDQLCAQAPQALNYQAVARDINGTILSNRDVGLKLTIMNGPEGEILYQETHQGSTNQFGLITVHIGTGSPLIGHFPDIPWGNVTAWMQVEMDPAGGTDYISMGLSQLLSVPYALFAATGNIGPEGPAGPKGDTGEQGIQGPPGANGTNGVDGNDGALWLTGNGTPPTELGVINDLYLDIPTGDFYLKTDEVTWTLQGNLKGPQGDDGTLPHGDQPGNTPYWNGTEWVLNNSNLFNNGGNIGINTVTPLGRLHVHGSADISQLIIDAAPVQSNANPLILVRDNAGTDLLWMHTDDTTNIFFGISAGLSNNKELGGLYNTFMGSKSGQSNSTGFSNTSVGHSSLLSNTLGFANTAIGSSSLSSNTTGYNNTAQGAFSLRSNIDGHSNTAIGNLTLSMNINGSYNTATGNEALSLNTIGNENTANGYNALSFNSAGYRNTGIGANALHFNTVGYENTASGAFALYSNSTGLFNTAHGAYALHKNSIGNGNTAIGRYALHQNTTASNNTAIGVQSLESNSTGTNNASLGAGSLQNNTVGNGNTAHGMTALFTNLSGNENTAVGLGALYESTTSSRNTAVGSSALGDNTIGENNTAHGAYALSHNTVGHANTALGHQALNNIITGSFNTAIGEQASFVTANIDNTTAIGYLAGGVVNTHNRVEIGNSSVTVIAGQVPFSTYSDSRIKDNVREDVPGLEFINRLRPVTYNLNIHRENEMIYRHKPGANVEWQGKYDIEKIRMTGFLAQDVEEAALSTGYDFSGLQKPVNPDELYSLRYSDFVMPLVKAVQELNQNLRDEVEFLKSQNAELSQRLEKLEAMMSAKNE